jgi:hypothetical protein
MNDTYLLTSGFLALFFSFLIPENCMITKLKQEQQNTKQPIGKVASFYVRGTRKEEEVPSRSSSCDFSGCRTLQMVGVG